MRIKKLAGGGLPPFVSYTNVAQPLPAYAGIGSSSSTAEDSSSSSKSSSSKSSSGSSGDIGFLNKEMQKILMENGLPSDVQYFLAKVDVFGNSIDPLDPHSQERVYTKLLAMLPEIKQNKAEYDDAIKHAREKGTLDQIAVTKDGLICVLNKETGKIGFQAPNLDLDPEKYEKLTNGQLLQMRAYSPGNAMDKGNFTTLVASSINFADIEKSIMDKIDKLGKTTADGERFVRKDSKAAQAMAGYEKLIEQGEDGVYKITEKTVNQDRQVKALLTYLSKSLTKQERGVLASRAAENGLTGEDGIQQMLVALIQGRISDEHDIKVSYDKQATNGSNTDEHGNKKTYRMDQIMQIVTGDGLQHQKITISPGRGIGYQVDAQVISWIPNASGKGSVGPGKATEAVLNSRLGRIVNTNAIHVGDQLIDVSKLSKMYYDGSQAHALNLPVKYDNNGQPVPNFDLIKGYEAALKEINKKGGMNAISPQQVNLIFQKNGLGNYFNSDGSLNTKNFMRFIGITLVGDESVFEDADELPGVFTKIDDDQLEEEFSTQLGADKKHPYKIDGDLYKAVAYIPVYDSFSNARAASGQSSWVSDPGYLQQYADEQMMEQRKNGPRLVNQLSKSQL